MSTWWFLYGVVLVAEVVALWWVLNRFEKQVMAVLEKLLKRLKRP